MKVRISIVKISTAILLIGLSFLSLQARAESEGDFMAGLARLLSSPQLNRDLGSAHRNLANTPRVTTAKKAKPPSSHHRGNLANSDQGGRSAN